MKDSNLLKLIRKGSMLQKKKVYLEENILILRTTILKWKSFYISFFFPKHMSYVIMIFIPISIFMSTCTNYLTIILCFTLREKKTRVHALLTGYWRRPKPYVPY